MYFRFRGNNIQVVKSQTDPSTGKAKSVPIGSINRATLAVSEKLATNVSPAELKEIESWVKRHQGVDVLKRKVAALTLAEQISTSIEWLEQAPEAEAAEVAEDLLAATAELRRVLSKRGLV
jgi:hypothetical protein